MSSGQQKQRLPVEINPFRLVDQGRELAGEIPVVQLPRLSELLYTPSDFNASAVLSVSMRFDRLESNLPVVYLDLSGEFELTCQRCLHVMRQSLEQQIVVVLVTTDSQAETVEGYETCLVEDERLFVNDLIEDEVLLSLPLVVAHEQCEHEYLEAEQTQFDSEAKDSRVTTVNEVSEGGEAQASKENPFAVLKDFKHQV